MSHPDPYAGYKTVAEGYIETFKKLIGPELWDAYFGKINRQDALAASFVGAQPGFSFEYQQFGLCLKYASPFSPSTIVVKDIAPEWIGVLGGLFEIDPRFFVNHFWWKYAPLPPDLCLNFLYKQPTPDMGPSEDVQQSLFEKVFSTQKKGLLPKGTWHRDVWIAPDGDGKDWCIPFMADDANIDSRRTVSDTVPGRRSYQNLLLIDGHRWTKAPRRPRGDILIADQDDCIPGRSYSEYLRGFSRDKLALFASRRASRKNHFAPLIYEALQDAHDILDLGDSEEFFLHLTATRCKADVSELEKQVTQIADADIADSDTTVFGQLHDSRRAVARLRSIATTVHVRAEGRLRKADLQRLTTSTLDECTNLRILIDETIQLVMGTITIKEAQNSRINSERATVLTFLACIYLPLTLVTGIFGMNIKEINGGAPSWWSCVIALAVIAFGTLGLGFWLYPTAAVHTLKRWASWAASRFKATLRYIQRLHLQTALDRDRLRAMSNLSQAVIAMITRTIRS
ncbi:hypothetical protein KC340_g17766 [Hortaea werneckii]|nr:hypothetical protein KC342_g9506 [Hortaea werneckii]KAI7206171.1 hypothetical protein KC365_g17348 [Hortaea werneckii]KAI7289166.1 hypothetical protein KC340_g17766 [Hortaea werneckii]KAI7372849.1 hypothetical protein KC328_g16975 [Hortaea werneckii]